VGPPTGITPFRSRREARLLQRFVAHLEGAQDQVAGELVELLAREFVAERRSARRRAVSRGSRSSTIRVGKLDLRRFRRHAQLGERVGIAAYVHAVLGLHAVGEQVDHAVVEVVAAG
jgi:hypothetical protein